MFYNSILIQLWKFLSYFYQHCSLIDVCLFLALPDPTHYLKTKSRAGFSFQHKKTLFTSFLNLLNRFITLLTRYNSAFCTLILLSGGKKERLIMWTMWQRSLLLLSYSKELLLQCIVWSSMQWRHETKLNICDACFFYHFLKHEHH